MQSLSWNDLKILLAVARAQSLSGAASMLGVDATTVSRRLKSLEQKSHAPLITRSRDGTLHLTDIATRIVDQAEQMDRHANAAQTLLGHDAAVQGVIRLTAVPFILNRLILPALAPFMTTHPQVQLSLLPENRNLSLTRREIDVAVRFGKPDGGGHAVLAQKIGALRFAVYTGTASGAVPLRARPWIAYDPLVAHLPQAEWTEQMMQKTSRSAAAVRVHDLETAYDAALSHPSRALLPCAVADRDERLQKVIPKEPVQEMNREIWMLRHRDLRGVERIDALCAYLASHPIFD